jgi:UDP-N-acetylmuramate: L-alanyl-gamma-D-glutamyl-meso-diaminopimelate ligase
MVQLDPNVHTAVFEGDEYLSSPLDHRPKFFWYQILEPSRSRLKQAGLLPKDEGWHSERITKKLDCVILGMHARPSNPELIQAQELGVKIQSYPEFLYTATAKDRRIVIGGSHGKTTITSMLLHAYKVINDPVNFMVGAQLNGFDRMVQLDPNVHTAVFEGDEYLSSPLDHRPKFFWYQAHFTLLTGIAWDHINVFPTEENYIEQFDYYLETLAPNAFVIWCKEDEHLATVVRRSKRKDLTFIPYHTPVTTPARDGQTILKWDDGTESITPLIGTHNMQNVAGARALAACTGIEEADFDQAMGSFTGAARRLELLQETESFTAFRDFAHAPSKLRATTGGVKDAFPNRHLTAVFELHTFSSLNKDFLPTYREALARADEQVVYYDPEVLAYKQLDALSPEFVAECFGPSDRLRIINSKSELQAYLDSQNKSNSVLLLMSSGWFGKVRPKWLD